MAERDVRRTAECREAEAESRELGTVASEPSRFHRVHEDLLVQLRAAG
jgi:hypothetical protein